MDDIRYYKGIIKFKKLSKGSSTKTALYRCLEDGKISYKENKYIFTRHFRKGELIIAPYRICHKKRKKVKKIV